MAGVRPVAQVVDRAERRGDGGEIVAGVRTAHDRRACPAWRSRPDLGLREIPSADVAGREAFERFARGELSLCGAERLGGLVAGGHDRADRAVVVGEEHDRRAVGRSRVEHAASVPRCSVCRRSPRRRRPGGRVGGDVERALGGGRGLDARWSGFRSGPRSGRGPGAR